MDIYSIKKVTVLFQGLPPTIGGPWSRCPGPMVARGIKTLERASHSHNGWNVLLAFLCLADSLPPPSKLSSKVMPSGKVPPTSLPARSCSISFALLQPRGKPQPSLHGSEKGTERLPITAWSTDNTCKRSSEKQVIKAAWSLLEKTSRRERRKTLSLDRGDKEIHAQR